jgi:hypothetical protein
VQWRVEVRARKDAISALLIELAQVVKVGNEPKGEAPAFTPMPSDAYRLALPALSRRSKGEQAVVGDAALAVAAYNASAGAFNNNFKEAQAAGRLKRTTDLARSARVKAMVAQRLLEMKPIVLYCQQQGLIDFPWPGRPWHME